MSAPRTMSETLERARDRAALIARQDADSLRLTERLDAEALRVLVEGFDAERATYATLEQEYAQAVRALRRVEFDGGYYESALQDRGCPACECHDDHAAGCPVGAVLSTPRAQAVKEVE